MYVYMKFAFKIGSLFFLSGCPTVWVAISCLCPQIVLRAFRPSPYPKHPAHASLSPVCWWLMQASRLLLHWELWLGAYSVGFFFFFYSQLCCPLRFQNSPQTGWWEGFLLFGNISSFTAPSPGRRESYLLSKRMGCLSGCLVSSTNTQKSFCGSFSASKWSFDEFVGEKVVSPSYSSTILGPPPWRSKFMKKVTRHTWGKQ